MIADPPVLAGAVQLTIAEPFPGVADRPVGAPGTVAGVTDAEAPDSTLFPMTFVAWMVKV